MEKRYGITGSVSSNYKWTGNITDRIIRYIEQEIDSQDPRGAGSNVATLSMEIQKGRYDGTEEKIKKWIVL